MSCSRRDVYDDGWRVVLWLYLDEEILAVSAPYIALNLLSDSLTRFTTRCIRRDTMCDQTFILSVSRGGHDLNGSEQLFQVTFVTMQLEKVSWSAQPHFICVRCCVSSRDMFRQAPPSQMMHDHGDGLAEATLASCHRK